MELNMMENTKMIREMVMEYSHMLMEKKKNKFGRMVKKNKNFGGSDSFNISNIFYIYIQISIN
jgi:hypothetical protein